MKTKWQYTETEIRNAVEKSKMYSEIFINLGLKVNGGSYPWIKNIIKKYEISTEHFFTTQERYNFAGVRLKQTKQINFQIPLPNGYRLKTYKLRDYMLYNGVTYECNICDLTEWRGDEMSLDIDHINSDPHDNKLDNLQFICPNCHRQKTQQDNIKRKNINRCNNCGVEVTRKANRCKPCMMEFLGKRKKPTKIEWPCDEYLLKIVWEKPTSQISKELGVSDKAVEKRIIKIGGSKPPRGYWTNKKCLE